MKHVKFKGTDACPEEIAFRGVTFPVGKSVYVDDKELAAKVSALPYFDEVEDAKDPADLKKLRAEYEKAVGKKPFLGWNAATLTAKIEDAQSDDENDD